MTDPSITGAARIAIRLHCQLAANAELQRLRFLSCFQEEFAVLAQTSGRNRKTLATLARREYGDSIRPAGAQRNYPE